MNKHKLKDAKFIFSRVLLELPYVYLNKPFGFHCLPPRAVVQANIEATVKHMQISGLKSVNQRVFSFTTGELDT